MRKYRLLMCSMFLCAGMVFNGCSEKEASKQPESVNEETTEDGKKKDTITLRLWGAEEDAEILKEMTDNFKSTYANEANIDIKIEAKAEADCKNGLLGEVTKAPDVFTFADDQVRSLIAGGVLEPIHYVDDVKSNNVEASVEAATINDKVYAYPITADNGYFMFYNKKYLSEQDVTSLDKILEVADKEGKKVAMDWTSGWYLYSFFGQTGLKLSLNDDGVTNTCTWNSKDGKIKGIDVAKSMLSISSHKSFTSIEDKSFTEGLKNETVIAGVSGTWNATAAEQAMGKNYGAVKLPTYTCAGQQVQMASFAGYKMVGVNSYTANREWAERLANWIASEDNQKLRFVKRSQGPSNTKAAASDEVKNSLAIQAILAQSEYSSLQRVAEGYWDATSAYGTAFIEKKATEETLQKLLDKMVKGITSLPSED
ncbi:MAG: extracellular solute-binding protein [bacterium]|nr:extracellular solute-binding protein [bacterium]